jgi:hypothetical protein
VDGTARLTAMNLLLHTASADTSWLRDDSLEDLDNLPAPEVIAREIVED